MRETAIKPAHDPQDESVCMAAMLTACWPLTAVVVYVVVHMEVLEAPLRKSFTTVCMAATLTACWLLTAVRAARAALG